MNERIREAQLKFKEPHNKMMIRLEAGNRNKWINAIKMYYYVAERTKWDGLPQEEQTRIINLSDDSLKILCKELCTEAINRDFVNWISTGNEGNIGRLVYTALL
jgi:hypothetical protein